MEWNAPQQVLSYLPPLLVTSQALIATSCRMHFVREYRCAVRTLAAALIKQTNFRPFPSSAHYALRSVAYGSKCSLMFLRSPAKMLQLHRVSFFSFHRGYDTLKRLRLPSVSIMIPWGSDNSICLHGDTLRLLTLLSVSTMIPWEASDNSMCLHHDTLRLLTILSVATMAPWEASDTSILPLGLWQF